MGRGGLIYHGYGVDIPWIGGHNAMARGFNILWVGASIYHG
jgi:hypothetical protein